MEVLDFNYELEEIKMEEPGTGNFASMDIPNLEMQLAEIDVDNF